MTTFVKHVDTSDELCEFSAMDSICVQDIRCSGPGFLVVYTFEEAMV